MKMIRFYLSVLIMLVFTSVAYASSKPVVILYSDRSKVVDLDDISTQSKANRIIYHMLHDVLPKKHGIKIKLKPIRWKRGLQLIQSGLADGIINASYNNERATYAVYPMKNGKVDSRKMLRVAEYVFYKHKNSSINWDGSKITKIDWIIASIASYAILKDLKKMKVPVREETNVVSIMRSLAIGRFKAAALTSNDTDEFMDKFPGLKKNIIKFEKPLKRKEYHLIFSRKFYKNNTGIANKIWNAIENYRSSKEYRELNRKFLNHE